MNRPNSGRLRAYALSSSRGPVGSWPAWTLRSLGGADHEPPAAAEFVLEKLEGIGALVGDVDQPRVGRQVSGPADPQSALACGAIAMLGECLVFGDLVATMEDLIHQPQHFSRAGHHGQDVVTEVATPVSFADLSQVADQRGQRGEVQFGGVVQEEDLVRARLDSSLGVSPRGPMRAWCVTSSPSQRR